MGYRGCGCLGGEVGGAGCCTTAGCRKEEAATTSCCRGCLPSSRARAAPRLCRRDMAAWMGVGEVRGGKRSPPAGADKPPADLLGLPAGLTTCGRSVATGSSGLKSIIRGMCCGGAGRGPPPWLAALSVLPPQAEEAPPPAAAAERPAGAAAGRCLLCAPAVTDSVALRDPRRPSTAVPDPPPCTPWRRSWWTHWGSHWSS